MWQTKIARGKRHQAIGFLPYHGVTLAAELLQGGPVQHRDLAADIFDRTLLLQLAQLLFPRSIETVGIEQGF